MWYTLPWTFDEFFYQYLPYTWITKTQILQIPQASTITNQSSLRTLDAAGQSLATPISSLPHVVLHDHIETLHLSFCTSLLRTHLSALRNITLANSINCLNACSFPKTVRSIRILLLYRFPNYMPPN